MTKTPHARMKDEFKTKDKLVEAVEKLATDDLWLDRINDVKGLRLISNAKLLRLHRILSDAKQRFGTREKLVGAILELEKRVKDAGYRQRLEAHPLPRLVDQHDSALRRKRRSDARAEPKPARKKAPAPKPAAATKKTPAKKAPGKKAPGKKAPAKKGAAKKASGKRK